MDSTLQTSASDDYDDITNERGRSCSTCSYVFDRTVGVSTEACAKEIVDKLMAKLEEKNKQLEENKKANEDLLANLEKARAVQMIPGTDDLKAELAIARQTIVDLQMAFWKSFPSPNLRYNIKVPSGNGKYEYLYVDMKGYLCTSTDDYSKGHFKFEKDSDGTISIQSTAKYLQIRTFLPSYAPSVMFDANEMNKSKFALICHPQQEKHQAGILVDIFVLANRCFLSADEAYDNEQNRLAANSPTAPANKFLILAGDVA